MTDYQTTPIIRGHEVLHQLLQITEPRGGHIAGGFARWCVTPNTYKRRNTQTLGDEGVRSEEYILPSIAFGDIDIFSSSHQSYYDLFKKLRTYGASHRESQWSVTWKTHVLAKGGFSLDLAKLFPAHSWEPDVDLQLIKPVHQGHGEKARTLPEILDTFDFSICRAGIKDVNHALVDPDFMQDEKNMRLRVKAEESPRQIILRLSKYVSLGYKIDSLTAFQNIAQLKTLEPMIRGAVNQICKAAERDPDLFSEALQDLYQTFIENNQFITREHKWSDWDASLEDWLGT
jgi:hypothetical protein